MTTWTHRVIIVPAALVEQAKEIGAALDPAGAGMYSTPLSADGAEPATHYVSSGLIDAKFAAILNDSALLHKYAKDGAQAQSIAFKVTQTQTNSLVANSIVSEDNPHDVFAEHGLKMMTRNEVA